MSTTSFSTCGDRTLSPSHLPALTFILLCFYLCLFTSPQYNSCIFFVFFFCNIRCFYLYFCSHLCLVVWNLHTPLVLYSYWSLELNQDVIYFLGGLWKNEIYLYIYICSRRKAGRETLNVLICDSQGSCRRPLENLLSLCLFLYFSSLLFPPSLPMLRSDFRSQFHSQPYFLSVKLILYPTIHSFYSPDVFFFLCLSLHFCVHFCFPMSPWMWPYCAL